MAKRKAKKRKRQTTQSSTIRYTEKQIKDSAEEIIVWLKDNYQSQYLLAFRDNVIEKASVPTIRDVIYEMILHGLVGKIDPVKAPQRELAQLKALINEQIITPFCSQYLNREDQIDTVRILHKQALFDSLDHCLAIKHQIRGTFHHLLDFNASGQFTKEEEQDYYSYYFLNHEGRYSLRRIFREPEFQQHAVKGFCGTCSEISKYDIGALHPILNWYLYHCRIYEHDESCHQILKYMQNICQNNTPQREHIFHYYEENRDTFNALFKKFPYLDFIEHGKCERYELLGDFAEKLGITMEEVYNFAGFFSEKSAKQDCVKTGKHQSTKKPADDKSYRTAILKALDRLHRQILHHATNVEWYNIWPNDIKRKTAKIVGKYIALTFQFKAKTWILVDSIEQGNAVYLWCGESLSEGLDILTMNKTYAKTQEGIHHRNHAILRIDTYEIYRKILKDADCLDVLG